MKRILFALAMIASLQLGYAQPRGGAPAGGNRAAAAVRAALETAEKDAADAKKSTKVATWMKLGEAYVAAHTASVGDAWLGATAQDLSLILRNLRPTATEEVVLKDQPLTKTSYGTYDYYTNSLGNLVAVISTNPVVENALSKAADAYRKAGELDTKGSKAKDISAAIQSISKKFEDEAFSYYTLGMMEEASAAFEKAADATLIKPFNTLDADLLYNAGFTAYESGNYARARDLLNKCLESGYEKDGEVFAKLGDAYGKLGEKELMKNTLETAFGKYPESEGILVSLINYYLTENADADRLFELITAAKAKDPKNASLYYVEGNINYQLGKIEEAAKCYEESAKIDPKYEFGYIGEGIMYYELAVAEQEKAQEELDDTKYAAIVEQFEKYLKACVEPFEKAFEVTEDNELKVNVSEYLKNACFRFRESDPAYQAKYDKYNKIVTEGL